MVSLSTNLLIFVFLPSTTSTGARMWMTANPPVVTAYSLAQTPSRGPERSRMLSHALALRLSSEASLMFLLSSLGSSLSCQNFKCLILWLPLYSVVISLLSYLLPTLFYTAGQNTLNLIYTMFEIKWSASRSLSPTYLLKPKLLMFWPRACLNPSSSSFILNLEF